MQIHTAQDNHDGVLRVGDTQGRLRSWFAQHNCFAGGDAPGSLCCRHRHSRKPWARP
ncbi:hypothetical protein O5707_06365 [Escherichia coli]|nr:hypothetical protein [Escherichia coli]